MSYEWEKDEQFWRNSPLAEARLVRTFADEIKEVQARLKKKERSDRIRRPFHAKIHVGVTNAIFRIREDLPIDLHVAFFQPGSEFRAIVRFSNASGGIRPDSEKDLRGIAFRVSVPQQTSDNDAETYAHDFLATNAPTSHARNAKQFMVAAKASAHKFRVRGLLTLLFGLGPFEMIRMVRVLRRDQRVIESMATEHYWSRAPIAFGKHAVKYALHPSSQMRTVATLDWKAATVAIPTSFAPICENDC